MAEAEKSKSKVKLLAIIGGIAVLIIALIVVSFTVFRPELPQGNGWSDVQAGRDVTIASVDGSPEVSIPGSAIEGSGRLSVRATDGPGGVPAWGIDLQGATLIGEAQIRFIGGAPSTEPPPLVGYFEDGSEETTYAENVTVDGNDLIVRTTSFSNWFLDRWNDITQGVTNLFNTIFADPGTGAAPSCERTDQVTEEQITVEAADSANTTWCIGKDQNDATILQVQNARGYGVAAEFSPGLSLNDSNTALTNYVPKSLVESLTAPSEKDNSVTLIGPGETLTFTLDAAVTAAGVRIQPSPPAYLATALYFGIETMTMVYSKIGSTTADVVSGSIDSLGCVSGFSTMASAEITDGQAAAAYLEEATNTVFDCSEKIFENLMAGSFFGLLAARIAEVVVWLWNGVKLATDGFAAAAETAFNPSGDLIGITAPEQPEVEPTAFFTVFPWQDGGAESAAEVESGASDTQCSGSNVTGRSDAFRCYVGRFISDPCFQDPTNPADFLCLYRNEAGNPVRNLITDVPASAITFPGSDIPDEGRPFIIDLADGTYCRASSGAGPWPIDGYEFFNGGCSGPSAGVWKISDANDRESPLAALDYQDENGVWYVAIEPESASGTIIQVAVVAVYR